MTFQFYFGIDPSVSHTGWSLVSFISGNPLLIASDVIPLYMEQGDNERYGKIFKHLYRAMVDNIPTKALYGNRNSILGVIEHPHFEDTDRGRRLARTGMLMKLTLAAGVAIGAVSSLAIPYTLPRATEWKEGHDPETGARVHLPKPRILERVEVVFPHKAGKWVREDEWEATALCLWAHAKGKDLNIWRF